MGGNQSELSNIGTTKGEGYRIINVRPNSPLDSRVDIFFDFIIDVIPSKEPQRNPRDILDKLSDGDGRRVQKVPKKLQQIFAENENSPVSLKIVSTKLRNVRTVQITPNRNWNGKQDLTGLETRLQRYDEAFETYFPISDIRTGSPVKKAGINDGDYLIGCVEFKYSSINQLLENVYDRYFDKTVENKTVHFAVYCIAKDELRLAPVVLARGWGDKGLLGGQFLEGHLNRFPKNLQEIRAELKMKKKQSDDSERIKKQLTECNGASMQLIESLKAQKSRKIKNFRQLKGILLLQPSNPQQKVNSPVKQQLQQKGQQSSPQFVTLAKYKALQNRVATLQQMLANIKKYIVDLDDGEEEVKMVESSG